MNNSLHRSAKYMLILLALSSCQSSKYLWISKDSLRKAWPVDQCEMLPYKRFVADLISDQYRNRCLKGNWTDILDILGKPDTVITEGKNVISYGYVVGPSDCGKEYKDGNIVFNVTFDTKTKKIIKVLSAIID